MKTLWILHVIETGQPTRELVAQDGLTIGRHADCSLVVADPFASAHHAKIVSEGDTMFVVDLGSNNGTQIGDSTLLSSGQKQALSDGMCIMLGNAKVLVRGPTEGVSTNLTPSSDPRGTVPESFEVKATVAEVRPVRKSDAGKRGSALPKGGTGTVVANRGGNSAGNQAKLKYMGARLLLLNEADLRTVEVESDSFSIGRESSLDCVLANRGVSSKHARIDFSASTNTFLLTDLGSANGTYVDGVTLVRDVPYRLGSDVSIRFGTVDALFLQSMDGAFQRISEERHENAASLLIARGRLTSSVVKQARLGAKERGVALGEVLLLGQHLEAREWAQCVKDAHVASTLEHLNPISIKRILFWVAVGLALGVAALMATSSGRTLLGIGD
ncbi:MAG TPA: FHA domain-containing protein [Planctomycetes bacterium]|nr:FHA domain-containing protein [Planctomycetota bacterium]HIL38747.1 FHA domain-containing protein [Planctomycetota bacterium]